MNLLFKPKTLGRFGILLLLLAASAASAAILTGSLGSHDPSRMINCAGTYYVYSTGGGMKYSTDRINWNSGTSPFPSGVPTSVKNFLPSNQGIWAPDVLFYNDKYYLYYAVAAASGSNCAIGLMTSPTLNTSASNYKWTDVGVVIYSSDKFTRRSAIDPCPFLDTSNNLWLSWGSGYANGAGYYTNTIFISKLDNTTGLSVSPADTNGTTISAALTNEFGVVPGHIEASFVYYHNGYYYVFWNSGGCCSGSASTYTIHMARSTNVTGPYFDQSGNSTTNLGGTTFLGPKATENSIIGEEDGPGQIGILSEGGIDRFTYHYYPLSGGTNGGADLGEETLIWNASGWPSAGADLAAGTYKVSSLNSGLAMGVYQGGTTNGTPLDQETYTGSTNQQWIVNYTTNGSAADGYYNITSVGSGQVVDLYQSNTNNGTLIDQWPWGNGNNQRWLIEQTSDGYYHILSRASQSVIDVTNFSNTSGTWLDERSWSNTVNQQWVIGSTTGTAPATPAGLVATAGAGQIALTWTTVSGATSYDVKRGTTSGGPYTTSIASPTAGSFTDTTAGNGVTYYYVVSAVNASGVSGKSSQADATPGPPAAPGGLTATAVSTSQINLTWTDNSVNENNFLIERSLNNTNYSQIGSVAAGVTNYSSTGLSPNTLYYYRVRATNNIGSSGYSDTNSATTLAVSIISTTTGLNALSAVTYGTPVTFTATVTPAPTTGDTVTFDDGVVTMGIGTTGIGGAATFTTTNTQLSAATHSITAVFAGDAGFAASTSGVSNQVVSQKSLTPVITLNSRPYDGTTSATTIATRSLIGIVGGDDVNLGSSGVVSAFTNPDAGVSPVNITGLSLSGTTAGNYTLASTSTTATGTITAINSITTINSSANPSGYNSNVAFTATVSGLDTPTGTVEFLTNGIFFDSETLAGGTATSVATALLPPGTNTITAAYSGDVNYLGSTDSISQVVVARPQFNTVSVGANGLVMGGTGGVPGGIYYVLGTTNMAAPITNWPPLLTNQFDDNGNFIFTNPIPPDAPQGFYLLQVP